MKRLIKLAIPLISSLTLTACLPSGGDPGGGGGGGGGEDASVNNGADVGNPNNDNNDNNDNNTNNTTAGKTCPDGSVIPVDQECVCPTSIDDCDDGTQCATVSFSPGSPCGTCTITQINQCGVFDGCCPSGCSPDNDDDCAGCGDGQRDPGETCDGDCPRNVNDCPDAPSACSTYSYEGSASSCNARCVESTISRCIDRDGCCPSGCDFDSDSDCDPPTGTARHGEPCLGAETACEGIDRNTTCVSQADVTAIDPFLGTLINPDGICTPLDCANSGTTCRDGTSCVTLTGIFPVGDPISACLKPCVDNSDCASGMVCSSTNPLDPAAQTHCI